MEISSSSPAPASVTGIIVVVMHTEQPAGRDQDQRRPEKVVRGEKGERGSRLASQSVDLQHEERFPRQNTNSSSCFSLLLQLFYITSDTSPTAGRSDKSSSQKRAFPECYSLLSQVLRMRGSRSVSTIRVFPAARLTLSPGTWAGHPADPPSSRGQSLNHSIYSWKSLL